MPGFRGAKLCHVERSGDLAVRRKMQIPRCARDDNRYGSLAALELRSDNNPQKDFYCAPEVGSPPA